MTNNYILTPDGGFYAVHNDTELYHYGVKGMKWGVRRFKQERNASIKKAHKSFQDDLKRLERSGRGKDNTAVQKRAEQYDNEVAAAKNKYKADKTAWDKQVKADIKEMLDRGIMNTQFITGDNAKWINEKNRKIGEGYVDYLYDKGMGQQTFKVAAGSAAISVGMAATMALIIGNIK